MTESLLVELFTEELPPKSLRLLGEAFGNAIQNWLIRTQLKLPDPSGTKFYATPRRLAVLIPNVFESAANRSESKKLMQSKIAFGPDGAASEALLKRLAKESASQNDLERKLEGDAEYVFLNRIIHGISLTNALQSALREAVTKLPAPKKMRYQIPNGAASIQWKNQSGDSINFVNNDDQPLSFVSDTVEFIRPAHSLIALYGNAVLEVTTLGLEAGRITHGHRFQGVKNISIVSADTYEDSLVAHGRIIPSFEVRRSEIERQLATLAKEHHAHFSNGAMTIEDEFSKLPVLDALLDEVTALVEYPTIYVGKFDADFLAVPQECLILTMRQNQKYFPLFDSEGKLINRFLMVSNMRLSDPKFVVEGNERVIRPRLSDARFFFDTDRKTRLVDRVPRLATQTYHHRLGSELERVERLRSLAKLIAVELNVDWLLVDRAALLSKADLSTNMVGEFPELQGVMGRYYAKHDGEELEVCEAIEQHYYPKFAGDKLPDRGVASIVALADKILSVTSLFRVDERPTGDKDPFALKRLALGVIRILVEQKLPLDLHKIILLASSSLEDPSFARSTSDELLRQHNERGASGHSVGVFGTGTVTNPISDESISATFAFFYDRLRSYLKDQHYSNPEIEAVLASQSPRIDLILARIEAVRVFKELPQAQSLAAANKRIRNILRKSSLVESALNRELFREPDEKQLHEIASQIRVVTIKQIAQEDYVNALTELARMQISVDSFFDNVMVMADDLDVRNNRLALLNVVGNLMNQVADISKLAE